jgi:hypothetical protein
MSRLPRYFCCGLALLTTLGCSRGVGDVETAQIVVLANPSLELIATDERQGVLTVRVAGTGQMMTVRAAEVVAGRAIHDLDANVAALMREPAGPQTQPTAQASMAPAPIATPSESRSAVATRLRVAASNIRAQVATTASATSDTNAPDRAAARAAASRPHIGANIDVSLLKRRAGPIVCADNRTIALDGVLVRSGIAALLISGNCDVQIRKSHIVGKIGIEVSGNADVSIDNSIVEGTIALEIAGNSTVSVRSSTVRGAVQRTGIGMMRDLGGNVFD